MPKNLQGLWAIFLTSCLAAQVPLMRNGRQQVLFEDRLYERIPPKVDYVPMKDMPPVPHHTHLYKSGSTIWDGEKLYHLAWSQKGDRVALEVGERVLMGPDGERKEYRWFWSEPHNLPYPAQLLGAWDGVVLLAHLPPKDIRWPGTPSPRETKPAGPPPPVTRILTLFDTLDNSLKDVAELQTPQPILRTQAAVADGSAFVFASTGEAFRVDFFEKKLTKLTDSFWKDVDLDLCTNIPAENLVDGNPRLFGSPFFDAEGAILWPALPMLFLDREDMERAWARLSPERRLSCLAQGISPDYNPDKKIGWKDWALFLKFDPLTRTFKRAELEHYAHWVEKRDVGYFQWQFTDWGTDWIYMTDAQGKIQTFSPKAETAPEPASRKPAGASPSQDKHGK